VTETTYRYHEGHFEPRLRQFQGFRRTERLEVGDESRPDTLTVFRFLMGQERLPGQGAEWAALNGMLQRTEIYGLDGSPQQDRPYRVEETDYGLQVLGTCPDGRQRTFVFAQRYRVEDTERGDDLRGEEKTYEYDSFGNVTRETLRGYGKRDGVSQPERRRTVETEYAQAAGRYRVDLVARIVVRDEADRILAERRRYYDGADYVGLPLGQASRGLPAREEHLVLSQADFEAHYAGMDAAALGYSTGVDADGNPAVFAPLHSHAYQAQGIKLGDRDGVGNETRYTYDASGLFRITLTNQMGTTQFEYDRSVGQPKRIIYPDGKETRFAYDAQGRVLAVALHGDSLADPPSSYRYDDSAVPHARVGRFRPSASGADESLAVTYFDGFGKEFQQRLQVSAGRFVVSGLREINPWGELRAEYQPTFSNSSAFALPATVGLPRREIFYDALGRVIRTVNYNGGVSTAEYHPFQVMTRDANDNDDSPENVARGQFNTPHCEEFDVLRQLTAVVEDLGGGQTRRVSYDTGLLGELLRVTDDQGVLATYTYDRRGSRLRIQHREAGDRRLWYDARRLVVRTVDADGNDLEAEIDAHNRLRQLRLDGAVIEEYTYDDATRNALGRLAEVAYQGGRQAFTYDAAGRLAQHTYIFDGLAAPQTLTYAYDRLGREIGVTHTDGTTFRRELTGNGWVRAIPGILDEVECDARGLPVRIEYANGVTSQMTYTPGPGRMETQNTTAPGGQVFQQATYTYDKMEMLLASDDASPGGPGPRTYAYDPLYQLAEATAQEAGATVTRRYDYVNLNLSRFEEADLTLHYDDALHPDRLAGLTPDGGVRFDPLYDANGNLRSLPGKRFDYNVKNELERFTAASGLTAEYRYDHMGLRVSKTVTDGGLTTRTFFVGELAEIRNGQTAYLLRLGPVRVAIVTGLQTRFVHPDPMGGTAFFTDAAATRIASLAYHPFGNIAASSGAVDMRTFGVHPFDAESGLYYMRKRYYAPEIGRFLTPDPLAIFQPQEYVHRPASLHVYAFVANDPLNKTDLAGLSFWSVFGAIVGVIVAIAVAVLTIATGGVFGVLLGIALAIAIVAVAYVVASATAGTDFGEFMRGFLIGFNAGMNAVLGTLIFGPVIGVALGVINFLAAFDTIAHSSVYQGILGWSSWLMPMSWLATGVGVIVFLLNVIPAIFTGNQVAAVRIESLSIDWGTGTIVMEGGWVFLPGFRGGYNLGNFAYMTPGSGVRDHETGHTLNVAAFGSIFHYIGAIDENAIQSTHANAYAERLADSHDPNGPAERALWGEEAIIPMWI
jgi:RHS repeat-associated protein